MNISIVANKAGIIANGQSHHLPGLRVIGLMNQPLVGIVVF
jgi:hypothetical protein